MPCWEFDGEDAPYGRAADLQPASDLGFADAGAVQFPDCSCVQSRRHGSAQPFAILPGVGQAERPQRSSR
jgi:hypothetical protein